MCFNFQWVKFFIATSLYALEFTAVSLFDISGLHFQLGFTFCLSFQPWAAERFTRWRRGGSPKMTMISENGGPTKT